MAKEKSVDVGIAYKNLHDAVHQESNEREDHAAKLSRQAEISAIRESKRIIDSLTDIARYLGLGVVK
jgi:hypothetical protein